MDNYTGLDPTSIESIRLERELLQFAANTLIKDCFSDEERDKFSRLIDKLYSEREQYLNENNKLLLQLRTLQDKLVLTDKDITYIESLNRKKDLEYFSTLLENNTKIIENLKEEIAVKDKHLQTLHILIKERESK